MKVKPLKIEPICNYCGKSGKKIVLINIDRNINDIGDVCVTKWCSNCGMAEIAYYRNWSLRTDQSNGRFLLPS